MYSVCSLLNTTNPTGPLGTARNSATSANTLFTCRQLRTSFESVLHKLEVCAKNHLKFTTRTRSRRKKQLCFWNTVQSLYTRKIYGFDLSPWTAVPYVGNEEDCRKKTVEQGTIYTPFFCADHPVRAVHSLTLPAKLSTTTLRNSTRTVGYALTYVIYVLRKWL